MRWISNQRTKQLAEQLSYLLPKDFDYQTYLALHPDLGEAGILDSQSAKEHYLFFGIKEKRPYKKEELIEIDESYIIGEKFFDSKNILYFSPSAPDYDLSSGGNRLLEILKILKIELNYNVYFLCNNPMEYKYISKVTDMGIPFYTIDIKKSIYLDKYVQSLKDNNIHFDYAIFSWYDIAHQYMDIVKTLYPNIKTIIDSVDVHWLRESRGIQNETIQTNDLNVHIKKVAEKNVYIKSDVIFTVTENDRLEIQKEIDYDLNIKILSNIHEPYEKIDIGKDILFIGNYSHKPNVDAALESIHIYNEFLATKKYNKTYKPSLLIAGPNITEDIVKLAAKTDGVEIIGYVENLETVYSRTMVLIAPLKWGAGIKGKICDAAMRSIPILTSDIGNEGIGLVNNIDAYIANSKQEFVNQLQTIYNSSPDSVDKIRFNGKNKVSKLVSKQAAISTLKHTLQTKHIVISIVTYNNHIKLKTCLSSIIDRAGDYTDYTIVVTDNSSGNDNKNVIDYIINKYNTNNIRYIKNESNEYFILPNNKVMLDPMYKNSDILLLNDDIQILSDNFLSILYSGAYSSNIVGAVGGKTIFPNGTLAEAGAELYNDGSGKNIGRGRNPDAIEYNIPKYVGYCSGCLLYMKRDTIDAIGAFDENLDKLYYEDSEWQYRAHTKGFKTLYQPLCEAIHHEGSSAGTDINTGAKRYQEINRLKFIEKYKNQNIEQYNE